MTTILNLPTYNTKEELIAAYAKSEQAKAIAYYGKNDSEHTDMTTFMLAGKSAAKYRGPFYPLGWVIEGFGRSIERTALANGN